MKIQAKAGATFARLDDSDAGEGVAIFFSQKETDAVRWQFDVYAKVDTGAELLVGTFFVSPPSITTPPGATTRQVGAAVCPGAKTWTVCAYPAAGPQAVTNETANITLTSSKCCTAPVGVSRVGERYSYRAGNSPAVFAVLPGRVVTRIYAQSTGAGTVTVGAGSDVITVPVGTILVLEPKAPIPANTQISFVNINWTVEFLESA